MPTKRKKSRWNKRLLKIKPRKEDYPHHYGRAFRKDVVEKQLKGLA